MTRRVVVAIALAVASISLAGCGGTSSNDAGPSAHHMLAHAHRGAISMSQGWVAATTGLMPGKGMGSATGGMSMGTARVSVAYAVITNDAGSTDQLIAVTTRAARHSVLHRETTTSGGSSGTMERVTSLTIPAGATLRLQPGGYHVMLMGLRHPLRPGEHIALTWKFRSGVTITTSFPVINRENRPAN